MTSAVGSMNIEPEKHEFQGRDGKWCTFMDDAHYQNTVEDGSWPIRALYTEAQMRQLGEACTSVCDDDVTVDRIRELVKEMLG